MTAAPYRDNTEYLTDELRRLGWLIRRRLESARLLDESSPHAQAARAVYITRGEVDWLLAVPDDTTVPVNEDGEAELQRLSATIDARVKASLDNGIGLGLPALGRLFGFSAVELLAIVICLAPELRRAYDRLYAYLQDDITRRRPSIDLALELLFPTERQRWAARGMYAATAPLLRSGVLRVVDDPHSPSGSSGLAQFLALDPRICQYLLGVDHLDARLVDLARVVGPDDPGSAEADAALTDPMVRLAEHHLAHASQARPVVFHLRGAAGFGSDELAAAVCRRVGVALLRLDLAALTGQGAQSGELLRAAFREGLLRQGAVHLTGADLLLPEAARPLLAVLSGAVADFGWLVFLSGESEWTAYEAFPGTVVQPIAVPSPDTARGTGLWLSGLAEYTADAAAWAADLAARFHLSPAGIRRALRLAENRRLMAAQTRELTLVDVSAACRAQSSRRLGELAVQLSPRYGWEDLVLPHDRLVQLREVCDQVRHHHRVYGSWGFGAKIGHGRGISALFSGQPGTGKTMAAEVLAAELDLDLYKVDLSGVVSKYIGETEKNLARIFAEARTGNAILFFDEADALFGKRTEVSDAHDRYANIETSYLLQKMEEFEGVVVLATNLRHNLDEAFVRRLRFIVEFPFPEAESRQRIWRTLVPREAPVAQDVDFAGLAREFAVAGGSIRNIVLNAAFLAAADGGVIDRRHILRGTRREYQKIGKLWPASAGAVDQRAEVTA